MICCCRAAQLNVDSNYIVNSGWKLPATHMPNTAGASSWGWYLKVGRAEAADKWLAAAAGFRLHLPAHVALPAVSAQASMRVQLSRSRLPQVTFTVTGSPARFMVTDRGVVTALLTIFNADGTKAGCTCRTRLVGCTTAAAGCWMQQVSCSAIGCWLRL